MIRQRLNGEEDLTMPKHPDYFPADHPIGTVPDIIERRGAGRRAENDK